MILFMGCCAMVNRSAANLYVALSHFRFIIPSVPAIILTQLYRILSFNDCLENKVFILKMRYFANWYNRIAA